MAKNKTKKDVYYFPHDYNPTSDPKMLAFVGEFGAVGYGIYWRIIEMLHECSEHYLPLKKYIYSAIAKQMLTDVEHVLKIVESCINDYELFESDDNNFWCNRVNRNVEKMVELIGKKKKGGDASAEARRLKKQQEEEQKNNQHNLTGVQQTLTDVEQSATHVKHISTEVNKLNDIKLNNTKEEETKINNQSNQNIYNNNIDADSQRRIDQFEKICQKFLSDDIQNFVAHFKTLDIREQNIKEALQDYKDDKLIGEIKNIPYTYSAFKEWFKKYIADNRAKYKHIPKMRLVSISDEATRDDLRVGFKFIWDNNYTLEYIKEKIFSGEFPLKENNYCVDNLIRDGLIVVSYD